MKDLRDLKAKQPQRRSQTRVQSLQEATTLQKCAAVPGGLVCKAHRLLYHPTLGLRVIKKEVEEAEGARDLEPRRVVLQNIDG